MCVIKIPSSKLLHIPCIIKVIGTMIHTSWIVFKSYNILIIVLSGNIHNTLMYIVRHKHKDKRIGKQLWLIFLSVRTLKLYLHGSAMA